MIDKLRGSKFEDVKFEGSVKIFKEEIKFRNELIQHFNAVTAAKILIEL